tara:strand:+ start:844 stop:1158 length:315 start_codon:yes stop_codon:yes gene_type:complete
MTLEKSTYFVIDPRTHEPIESMDAKSAPSVAKRVAKRKTKNVKDFKPHKTKVHVMKDTVSGKTVKVFEVTTKKLKSPKKIMIQEPQYITIHRDVSSKLVDSYKI